jgi:hypothetical protein
MLQTTLLPQRPATPPNRELLTGPSSHRSNSPTAFHHTHLEHVRVVQMFTLVCLALHPYFSSILCLEHDSEPLMLTAPTSHFTALLTLYS